MSVMEVIALLSLVTNMSTIVVSIFDNKKKQPPHSYIGRLL